MASAGSDPEAGNPSQEDSAPEAHVPVSMVTRVVGPAILQRYLASWADFYEYLLVYEKDTRRFSEWKRGTWILQSVESKRLRRKFRFLLASTTKG
ncbi:hypothetical protein JG688_00015529 [Phytophthora aleatoria]|uniref:Uncharacterized protein n=1 Tax=Phytophthora aleatoria TaxID=2496075 RepID=A0A8J5MDD2_9STRA|nr:hypothetical protein JG688_00015529 [Phytophthora aleatoria]